MAVLIGCDINTLIKDGNCFNNCGSSTLVNQAQLVYLLEQVRAKKAGVAARTPNQLRSAAACLGCQPIDPVADGLDVAIAQQWAVNVGVAGTTIQTRSALQSAATQFINMSLDDLRTIEVLIRCALAQF